MVPDSVTQIGCFVFGGCNNLTSVIVSKNNSRYKSTNNCILTKDGKKLIFCLNHNIPDGVTEIGELAFSGCTRLQSIVIPDSVTLIGELAFQDCTSLQSIVIPDSVTKIGESAFFGCTSLQSIVIPDSVTEVGGRAFRGCTSLDSVIIATQEKEPDLSLGRIKHLLQALSEYSKIISLRVAIGRGYAYRHHPAFEDKFKNIIADIDV